MPEAAALSTLPLAVRAGANADIDVAIVGGGVAGTYAAWRIASEQPHLRVALFEMSDRIGQAVALHGVRGSAASGR